MEEKNTFHSLFSGEIVVKYSSHRSLTHTHVQDDNIRHTTKDECDPVLAYEMWKKKNRQTNSKMISLSLWMKAYEWLHCCVLCTFLLLTVRAHCCEKPLEMGYEPESEIHKKIRLNCVPHDVSLWKKYIHILRLPLPLFSATLRSHSHRTLFGGAPELILSSRGAQSMWLIFRFAPIHSKCREEPKAIFNISLNSPLVSCSPLAVVERRRPEHANSARSHSALGVRSIWTLISTFFFRYLISHIKCCQFPFLFCGTSAWVPSLAATAAAMAAYTNFIEMNWIVRGLPFAKYVVYLYLRLRLNKYEIWSGIGHHAVHSQPTVRRRRRWPGHRKSKCFVVSIEGPLCVCCFDAIDACLSWLRWHTRCACVYWVWVQHTRGIGNVNNSPSTRLKSIYVQSIFHLCQFKLIETKWKLSADFYTSFSSLDLPQRRLPLLPVIASRLRVFLCRFVAIVCLCFSLACSMFARRGWWSAIVCETHTQARCCHCREWNRYWSNKCRMVLHRVCTDGIHSCLFCFVFIRFIAFYSWIRRK